MSDIYNDPDIQFDGGPPEWGERLAAPADIPADVAAARGVAVHQNGRYVAIAHDTSPYLEVLAFDPVAMAWVDTTGGPESPSTVPSSTSINGVAWHPDGGHLAVVGLNTTGDNIFVYEFDAVAGTIGTQTDTHATSTAISGAAFSPCGDFIALADNDGGRIFDFDKVLGDIGSEREAEAIVGEPTHAVAWSHGYTYGSGNDEVYVAWAHDKKHPSVQYVTVFSFDRTTKAFVEQDGVVPANQPSGAASESATGVSWRSDDRGLAAAITAGGSNELFVWAFDPIAGAPGDKYAQATVGDEAKDVAWMPDNRSVVTTHSDGSAELLMWPIDFIAEAIEEPIVLASAERPSGNARAIAIGNGEGAIAFVFASQLTSPYVEAWPVVMNLTFDGAHVTLSGSFVPGAIEADIVAGGRELIATVEGDLWLEAAGGDNTVTDDIISGITGSLSGAGTWDAEVTIARSDVERLSPAQLKITIPAASGYSVATTETITVSSPASALVRSTGDVTAKPSPRVLVDELAEARVDSHLILQTARHMIWQNPNLGYKFFVDSEGDVAFRRTIDAGASWHPPEKITSDADVVTFDLYYERWSEENAPNRAYLLWGDATSNEFDAQVATFADVYDPEINAVVPRVLLGDVECVEQVTSLFQGTTTIEAACSIVKRPKGRAPVAIYHGSQSASRGVRRRFIDGSWGTLYAPPSPFSVSGIHQMVLWPLEQDEPTTSGDLALIYWDLSAGPSDGVNVLGYDSSTNAWSSKKVVQSNAVHQLDARNAWASGYLIRDGRIFVTFWEKEGGVDAAAALRLYEINGPASAPVVRQRAAVTGDEDWGACCALTIDQTTTHLYVAYGRSAASPAALDKLDVFWKVYQSGGRSAHIDDWGEEFEVKGSLDADLALMFSDPGSSNSGRFLPVLLNTSDVFDVTSGAGHEVNTGVVLHHPFADEESGLSSVDKNWTGHLVPTSTVHDSEAAWSYPTDLTNPGFCHSGDFHVWDDGNFVDESDASIYFRASAVGGDVTGRVIRDGDKPTGEQACISGPLDGGYIVTVDVLRDGVRVGRAIYRHADNSLASNITSIDPGDVISNVWPVPSPAPSCYTGAHVHIEWQGLAGEDSDPNYGGMSSIDVRTINSGPVDADRLHYDQGEVVGAVIPVRPEDHPKFLEPPINGGVSIG